MNAPLKRNAWLAVAALLASSGTLVCCVLPAVMVALGAGATLASLVSSFPQLIWLSEHKTLVFGAAVVLLLAAGASIWRSRRLPCPSDPNLAATCIRLRRFSLAALAFSFVLCSVGALFAFVLPFFA